MLKEDVFSIGAETVDDGVRKTREMMVKKRVDKFVLKERGDSSLVLYVESNENRVPFKILYYLQYYKVRRSVTVFIADLGILINFSSENIRAGWEKLFRAEADSAKIWVVERKITFRFNAQLNKVLPLIGILERSDINGFLKKGRRRMFAECVPRRNSCSISFFFNKESVEFFKKIIYIPSLLDVKIEII